MEDMPYDTTFEYPGDSLSELKPARFPRTLNATQASTSSIDSRNSHLLCNPPDCIWTV